MGLIFISMIVLAVLIIALQKGQRVSQRVSGEAPLDYRCNGHYLVDSPDDYTKYGRTDRFAHHAEGDAYKVDKHKHF